MSRFLIWPHVWDNLDLVINYMHVSDCQIHMLQLKITQKCMNGFLCRFALKSLRYFVTLQRLDLKRKEL